ncbi:MAG: SOS response-associated peptidase family protein, partial [Candidatus Micrarchaeaceae archaeon]
EWDTFILSKAFTGGERADAKLRIYRNCYRVVPPPRPWYCCTSNRHDCRTRTPARTQERFEAEQTEELRPRYNIAPSQPVLIIRQDDGRRTVAIVRWGLVPFWAKDVSIGYKMINAGRETFLQKPADGAAGESCMILTTTASSPH